MSLTVLYFTRHSRPVFTTHDRPVFTTHSRSMLTTRSRPLPARGGTMASKWLYFSRDSNLEEEKGGASTYELPSRPDPSFAIG
jgi:hypothetical protein